MSARERWDARWAADSELHAGRPHPEVTRLAAVLKPGSVVLDIAAGRGRQSLCLARAGHCVTAADVSAAGLRRLRQGAQMQQVKVETVCVELADLLPDSLAGPWQAIVCVDFKAPALWAHLRASLAPGGVLFVSLATTENLTRHVRPSRRFLVAEDAGAQVLGSLTPEVVSTGWRTSGRHELWVRAVRAQG